MNIQSNNQSARQELSQEKKESLARHSLAIRKRIIIMLLEAKSGHAGGPLGLSDIFSFLFFHALSVHEAKDETKDETRDRFILSNGHTCPVYYATLIEKGIIPDAATMTLRKFGSILQGHPHREFLPLLETSSGPLGSGISQGVGMALGLRLKNKNEKVIVITGDGELDEGNNWEGIMLAGKEKLSNLCVIVDRNNIQIDGNTEDILPLEPLGDKWRAFNWNVIEVSGHDFDALNAAWEKFKECIDSPSVLFHANENPLP